MFMKSSRSGKLLDFGKNDEISLIFSAMAFKRALLLQAYVVELVSFATYLFNYYSRSINFSNFAKNFSPLDLILPLKLTLQT